MSDFLKQMSAVQVDAVQDKPDKRDYLLEEVTGGVPIQLPSRYVRNFTKAWNQAEKHDPITTYGCVFYGSDHSANEANYAEFERNGIVDQFVEHDPALLVKEAFIRKLIDLTSGAFVQSGPKLLKDLGVIS